jgi:hypothetical protein
MMDVYKPEPFINNHIKHCMKQGLNIPPHLLDLPPHPPMKPYPSEGKMQANGFMVINSVPLLYDNTHVTYGQRVIVSDNLNTEIYQVKDTYRLNLNATFDMTNDIITNSVLQHYLKEYISSNIMELNGVLPIMRHYIKLVMDYIITDSHGVLISRGQSPITINDMQYHATEIDDYFLNSCRGAFNIMIPPITYPGIYKFTIERISAYVDVIDTNKHIIDNLNPYYQFIDNNTKIAVQHDKIVEDKVSDKEVLISACDINKAFTFDTTRVKHVIVSFTSYLSEIISFNNTFEIWEAFNSPKIDLKAFNELQQQVVDLTRDVETLSKQLLLLDKLKVDVEEGKGLSTNDYTNADKSKLDLLSKSGAIVFKPTVSDFPEIGDVNTLYIATSEELSYIWNPDEEMYKNIDRIV